MKYIPMVIMLLLSLSGTCPAVEEVTDTRHYDVVAEYIRSLGGIHNMQETASKEFQNDNAAENPEVAKMMSAIRNGTRAKLILNTSISALKTMKLKKPFDTLLPTTIYLYEQKIELHNESITVWTNKTRTGL
jgi:hypothetical protein